MIFEEDRGQLKEAGLPFNVFVPDDGNYSSYVRYSYTRPTSLKLVMETEYGQIRIKEYFMDWFYYGFPKNQMKSAVDYYGMESIRNVKFQGVSHLMFSGLDYKGNFTSTIFIGGTLLEFRHSSELGALPGKILQGLKQINKVSNSFMDSSFICNYWTGDSWFENNRIASLKWRKLSGESLFDYKPDSVGSLERMHKISILKNNNGEFLWVDISRKNTGIKNLRYRFSRGGNIFKITKSSGSSFFGSISEYGPYLYQTEDQNFVYTVTVPRMDEFVADIGNFHTSMENLNLSSFLP